MSPRIPIYSCSKIWPWESKVKVMGEVNVESHNMGPIFYRLASLSFHVNRRSHSWDTNNNNCLKIWPWKSKVKVIDHGHGWGQSWKSQSGCHTLLIHIPFVPCKSTPTFLRYKIFQIWPWNSKVKVIAQGHKVHVGITPYWLTSLSFHINRASHSSVTTFTLKSRVKVMGEVTVQSHNVGLASYRLTSLLFHVNRPTHSWDTAFSKFDLENPGPR